MNAIMTLEEVADLTRLPKATLRFYRHRGHGGPRSFKIGNRVCYRRDDVEEYIQTAYAESVR